MHKPTKLLHKFISVILISVILFLFTSQAFAKPLDKLELTETKIGTTWFLDAVKAPQAWDLLAAAGKPQNSIKVAVIDSGVQRSHPNLQGSLAPIGYDAVNNLRYEEGHPNAGEPLARTSGFAHGTGVASIIAARTIMGGTTGVASNYVQIVPINVKDTKGNLDPYIVKGFEYAIEKRVDVINFSAGGYGHTQDIENAIRNAIKNNIVVIASSGNEGRVEVIFPANIDVDGIMAVGNLNEEFKRFQLLPPFCIIAPKIFEIFYEGDAPCGSNYGNELDIMAPGDNIWGADLIGSDGRNPNGDFVTWRGTSFSTPIIAATAAMIKLADNSLRPNQIQEIIQRTATKISQEQYKYDSRMWQGGWNQQMGYGLVNAYNAVYSALNPTKLSVNARLEGLVYENHASQVALAVFGKYPPKNADINLQKTSFTLLGQGIITTDNSGNPISSLSLPGVLSGDYLVCAKPQFHLSRCLNIYLSGSQQNTIDFSINNYLFLVGEFNSGGEDHVINSIDLEKYRKKFKECYALGNPPLGNCIPIDSDRNGVINSRDWNFQTLNFGKKNEYITVLGKLWKPFNYKSDFLNSESTKSAKINVILYSNQSNPDVGMNYDVNVWVDLSQLPNGAGSTDLIIRFDPGVWEVIDKNPDRPGIQVITYTSVFPYSSPGDVDIAKGEVNLGSLVGSTATIGSTKSGVLATLPLVAKAGIPNTKIWAIWEPDETVDSNMAEFETGIDLIGNIQDMQTAIVGAQRQMPIISFDLTSESYITTNKTKINVHASDVFNQIEEIQFQAFYDFQWHYIGSDFDSSDGWNINWDSSLLPDQHVVLWAAAILPGGTYSEVYTDFLFMDRTAPLLYEFKIYPFGVLFPGINEAHILVDVEDNFSGFANTECFINTANDGSSNGEWVLVKDTRGNLITVKENTFSPGLHLVRSVSYDNAGNFLMLPQDGNSALLQFGYFIFLPSIVR